MKNQLLTYLTSLFTLKIFLIVNSIKDIVEALHYASVAFLVQLVERLHNMKRSYIILRLFQILMTAHRIHARMVELAQMV